jgi:hydrogenase maturation protease
LHAAERILIYAYGNPGRQDDGLGNRFVEELEKWIIKKNIPGVELESNYQLNIEDSVTIAGKDTVIFVDASNEDIEDIHFSVVEPSEGRSEFTTHAASPSFILALCIQLYNKHPKTYLLQIRGYEWEFREGLSKKVYEEETSKVLKSIPALFFTGILP